MDLIFMTVVFFGMWVAIPYGIPMLFTRGKTLKMVGSLLILVGILMLALTQKIILWFHKGPFDMKSLESALLAIVPLAFCALWSGLNGYFQKKNETNSKNPKLINSILAVSRIANFFAVPVAACLFLAYAS